MTIMRNIGKQQTNDTPRTLRTVTLTPIDSARHKSAFTDLQFTLAMQDFERKMQQLNCSALEIVTPQTSGQLAEDSGSLATSPKTSGHLETSLVQTISRPLEPVDHTGEVLLLAPPELPEIMNRSALDILNDLVEHKDDTALTPATKIKRGEQNNMPWPSGKREPGYMLSEMTSDQVITSPLAAIEAAIINHLETYRMLPDTVYVATSTYEKLVAQHERVKYRPFNGIYYYYAGDRLIPLAVKTEEDFPRWWLGINRDQVYCAAF